MKKIDTTPRETREERRARRKREFLAAEGPAAVRHDKRTWASYNTGKKVTRADLGYLKKFPEAANIADARKMAAKAEAARLAESPTPSAPTNVPQEGKCKKATKKAE